MKLVIENINKQFKDKHAVSNACLELTPGVWGLLGANGAGKTTLMRIIADILKPSSGKIMFNDKDISALGKEYRDIFGFLPQDFGFYHGFTVKEYLEYISALKGISKKQTKVKIEELLNRLSLYEKRHKKITTLSGGMKRRVGIAQAIINNPKILILDEPTAGLDPGERVRFRKFISEFSKDRIVLISTHIVSDIEYIATKNAIMKDGRIISVGTTEELVKEINNKVWEVTIPIQKLQIYETELQIVNQKMESNNKVSIRYLSNMSKIDGSISVPPRLEDLYLWLFPQEDTQEKRGEIL